MNRAAFSGLVGISPKLTLHGILDGAIDGVISNDLSSAVYGTDFLEGFSSSMVRGGSGELHSGDKWNFCLNLA